MTFDLFGNAIGSQELEDGPTRSNSPDGETDLFGQDRAHVNLSRPRENKAAVLTTGISGLNGFGSSESVDLTQLLANKLKERLGSDGSIKYLQTWKMKVTPAGRRYWAHIASARRTSDSGCSGWPTPDANTMNLGESLESFQARQARLKPLYGNGAGMPIAITAQLAGWPTATARDWKNGQASDETMNRNARPLNELANQVPGVVPNGSPASTEKRGALNPAFSLWLMGFTPQWMDSAPSAASVRSAERAMRLSRK